jgi:hypothetical protein
MAEWTSNHDYATRVGDLSGQAGSPGFSSRLNGNYFLIAGQTVFNDASTDLLAGGAGSDWLFAGTADMVFGLSAADTLVIVG